MADVELTEHGEYLEARYLGAYSLGKFKKQMEESIRACPERKKRLLLVDLRGLSGFNPKTFERHQMGALGAELSRGLAKVVIVGTPEQLDPELYAIRVARNRGLTIRGFVDREEAVRWLLEPAAPDS